MHAAIQDILHVAEDGDGSSFAGEVSEARGAPVTSAGRTCSAGRAVLRGVRHADYPRHGRGRRDELLPALPATLEGTRPARLQGSCKLAQVRLPRDGCSGGKGDAVHSKIKIAGHPST